MRLIDQRSSGADADGPVAIRMAFGADVVGYSARTSPAKEQIQRRLAAIVGDVLADLDLDPGRTDQQGAGDSIKVLLPVDLELHRALPKLLSGFQTHLAHDNTRHHDRMHLRLAAAIGPVSRAALGFGGNMIVELSRMLDSDAPRRALAKVPTADLAVMISRQLVDWVVGEGYPGLNHAQLRRVRAGAKGFSATAWLWLPR